MQDEHKNIHAPEDLLSPAAGRSLDLQRVYRGSGRRPETGHIAICGLTHPLDLISIMYVKPKDTLGLHLHADDSCAKAGHAQLNEPASPGIFREPTKRLAVAGLTKIKRRRKLKAFSAPVLPHVHPKHLYPVTLLTEIKQAGQQVRATDSGQTRAHKALLR